jgi:hypothetical protein
MASLDVLFHSLSPPLVVSARIGVQSQTPLVRKPHNFDPVRGDCIDPPFAESITFLEDLSADDAHWHIPNEHRPLQDWYWSLIGFHHVDTRSSDYLLAPEWINGPVTHKGTSSWTFADWRDRDQ